MPAPYRFMQVDVFTRQALLGNPLAVVLAADDLDASRMQAFARWTNLSETTFLLRPTLPGADYRVRIFTPGGELPFAGHPTLGSCHAWLAAGGRPAADHVVQQCAVGAVRIRRDGEALAFEAPPLTMTEVSAEHRAAAAAALRIPERAILAAQWLDNGPKWLSIRLADARSVRALAPDHAAVAALAKIGVVGPCDGSDPAVQFEVRAFAAPIGVPEDPVTGSLNAGLAAWLTRTGVAPHVYTASQGSCLGREGRVRIRCEGDTIWVGGDVAPCIEGQVRI